jgi:hypothetical protein
MIAQLISLFGLLSPFAQSQRELQAILENCSTIPTGEMIQSVVRTDGGYVVVTSHYTMQVGVEYFPNKHPGPVPFELHFGDLIRE